MNSQQAYQHACTLYKSGKHLESKSIFSKLHNDYPQNSAVCNMLARSYFALKNFPEALELFEKSIVGESASSNYYHDYIVALQLLEMNDKTIEVLKKAIHVDPENDDFLRRLAALMILKQDYEESLQLSKHCLELNPTYGDYSNLCTASFFLGKEEKAKKFGTKALVMRDEEVIRHFVPIKDSVLKQLKNRTFNHLKIEKRIKPSESENIIAFSLWGDNPTYLEGAIENAKLAVTLYPDWVCRFYCDRNVPEEIISALSKLHAQVFIMPPPKNPADRYAWRFFVTDDPTVKRFICRDADSKINSKEVVAVEAWFCSEKSFHVMRDAIVHCTLMLAGLWGGLNAKIQNLYVLYDELYQHHPSKWGDQKFLAEFVWPLIKSDALVHDTYYQFEGTTFPGGGYSAIEEHVGRSFKR